jgi:predicted SpoU family rRNA methylase
MKFGISVLDHPTWWLNFTEHCLTLVLLSDNDDTYNSIVNKILKKFTGELNIQQEGTNFKDVVVEFESEIYAGLFILTYSEPVD